MGNDRNEIGQIGHSVPETVGPAAESRNADRHRCGQQYDEEPPGPRLGSAEKRKSKQKAEKEDCDQRADKTADDCLRTVPQYHFVALRVLIEKSLALYLRHLCAANHRVPSSWDPKGRRRPCYHHRQTLFRMLRRV